jgi:NADPH:quinone reductase-like Zn-dependent oxidoreductase
MKSIRLESAGNLDGLQYTDIPEPQPGKGKAVVRVRAAAINHRDLFICEGKYAKIKTPVTLGSDASGTVESVGDPVDAAWIGQDVVIDPSLQWGDDPRAQGKDYRILGMPDDGTLAEKVSVPVSNLHRKPDHLSYEEAAALPLAGVTAFRCLFVQGRVKKSDVILMTGIGGGVASIALKLAVAAGARVVVTSGSTEKINAARSHGAEWGFTDFDALKSAGLPPIDTVIDSIGGTGLNDLLQIVRPGGRIVVYGATLGLPASLDVRRIFWKQLTLQGSTMGSPEDFTQMIDFVARHNVRPIIADVIKLSQARRAFEIMSESRQFGKIILKP